MITFINAMVLGVLSSAFFRLHLTGLVIIRYMVIFRHDLWN